jgi:hypothetical protein
MLVAFVSSASAGRLSFSERRISATWTRLNFAGGFGTVECEAVVPIADHERVIAKVTNTLIGYVLPTVLPDIIVNIPRCSRGGATILRELLPWHLTERAHTGTLPNITSMSTNVIGMAFGMREPTFGATCLARSSSSSPMIMTYNREAGGRVTSVTVSGTLPCSGALNVAGALSGTSSSVSAITLTLI